MSVAMWVVGRAMVRPLLVVTLGLGIALMHAFGHPGDHGHPFDHACTGGHVPDSGSVGAIVGAGPHHSIVVPVHPHAATTAPARQPTAATPVGGTGGAGACGDTTTVCLAVLTLGGLALLALVAMHRRGTSDFGVAGRVGRPRWARMLDPPRPAGLRLARFSVLRI